MKKNYKADLNELENIAADTEIFCKEIGADDASAFALNLCLDEIFTNIVQYGYKSDASKTVQVEYLCENGDGKNRSMRVFVRDWAPPFNPLVEADTPDTSSGIDEREIGGLGIFLLKKNMDELEYSRKNDVNELMMLRNFK